MLLLFFIRQPIDNSVIGITKFIWRIKNPDPVFRPDDVDKFDQKFGINQNDPFELGEGDDSEGEAHETHFKYDVKLKYPNSDIAGYIELKSYSKSTIERIHTAKAFKAHKQFGKYLANTTDINNLRYTFNKRKLLWEYLFPPFGNTIPDLDKGYFTVEDAEADIKNQFRRLMGAEIVDGNGNIIEEDLSKAQNFVSIMNPTLKLNGIPGVEILNAQDLIDNIDIILNTIIKVE